MKKSRNWHAVSAQFRSSAGPMKNKSIRGSGKGKGKVGRHPKHKGKASADPR